MSWALMDRRDTRRSDEVLRTGYVREQDFASRHIALAYRAARIRRAVLRCVRAKRVMREAEMQYLESPQDVAARVNYALYQHAVARNLERAKTVYIGLLDWMTRRGPDEPIILYGFALLLAVTHEEPFDVIEVMIERARAAEEASRN